MKMRNVAANQVMSPLFLPRSDGRTSDIRHKQTLSLDEDDVPDGGGPFGPAPAAPPAMACRRRRAFVQFVPCWHSFSIKQPAAVMCDNGNMLCRSWPKFLLLACVVNSWS